MAGVSALSSPRVRQEREGGREWMQRVKGSEGKKKRKRGRKRQEGDKGETISREGEKEGKSQQ